MDWKYDELKQIGTDYTDLEEVREYDTRMQKLRNVEEEVEEIIKLTRLTNSQTVLDIGTGTGEIAVRLANYCRQVYALDISKLMLEFARQKAKNREVDNVEFSQGGFLTCEVAEDSIDVVVTQLVLHHLPDFWKLVALDKVFDLLKNGGRLYIYDVVFDFEIDNYEEQLNNFIELTGQASDKMAENTKQHIREEFSTFSWVLEGMLKRAGFTIEEVDYETGLFGTYVCKKGSETDES
jgi:ubiquinone/menaquinone biosynthesis C-methylase UbiE